MTGLRAIPAAIVLLLLGSMGAQFAGLVLIPRTEGFTKPLPTLLCSACLILSAGGLAQLSRKGIDFGVLFPLMSAGMQLCMVLVGIFVYGESTSLLRFMLLLAACACIGWAAALS